MSLPNKTFLCNYNARDFVAATNTIPNASGASFNQDAVLTNGTPTSHIADGYITIPSECKFSYTFPSASDNPFNRSGLDTLTIVAKTSLSRNSSSNIVSNRGSDYNWMLRNDRSGQVYLHTRLMGTPIVVSTVSANTYSFVVSNEHYVGRSWTDNVSVTSEVELSGVSETFELFTNTRYSEPWSGDFYWVYISPEALTDAEIQQVINHNEALYDVTPHSKSFDATGGTATFTVQSDYSWTATTADAWITINPTAGTSADTSVSVSVPDYSGADRRRGTITFTNSEGDTVDVRINQNGTAGMSQIYLGDENIRQICLGEDSVTIYMGDTLIFTN